MEWNWRDERVGVGCHNISNLSLDTNNVWVKDVQWENEWKNSGIVWVKTVNEQLNPGLGDRARERFVQGLHKQFRQYSDATAPCSHDSFYLPDSQPELKAILALASVRASVAFHWQTHNITIKLAKHVNLPHWVDWKSLPQSGDARFPVTNKEKEW